MIEHLPKKTPIQNKIPSSTAIEYLLKNHQAKNIDNEKRTILSQKISPATKISNPENPESDIEFHLIDTTLCIVNRENPDNFSYVKNIAEVEMIDRDHYWTNNILITKNLQ